MIAVVLLGLVAAAVGAPQYFGHHPHFAERGHLSPYLRDDVFDSQAFWGGLEKEMKQLDDMIADLNKRFKTSLSNEGIQGNEYIITVPLNGYDEKDIVVKAREGLLMIQAVHKFDESIMSSYLDVRTLPENVNVTGSWRLIDGVLKIVFPLKAGAEVTTELSTEGTTAESFSTEGYKEQSREELEPSRGGNDMNVDVGLVRRGDTHLLTNEVPTNEVEATTYAVDLKDEIEFVPVHY